MNWAYQESASYVLDARISNWVACSFMRAFMMSALEGAAFIILATPDEPDLVVIWETGKLCDWVFILTSAERYFLE